MQLYTRRKRAIATIEETIININNEDEEEVGNGNNEDGGIDRGLGKAEGDARGCKKRVIGVRGFTNAAHGLVEFANETSARGGRDMITFRLIDANVRSHVSVEESRDDIHLFYLKIVKIGKREKNTKSDVPDCRGENGGVINILHVATGNEAGLVHENNSGDVAFNLVIP